MLSIPAERLAAFEAICARERCPYAVIGELTAERVLTIEDSHFRNTPVAMPMDVLFGKPPKMTREAGRLAARSAGWDTTGIGLSDAIDAVLRFPAVADKSFLIHIGDRTVGGLSVRDQLVGPWQVPVSDVAVTASSFAGYTGEAMAVGERTPVAIRNGPASARLAVVEAVTNALAADVAALGDIRLSANWMAAAGHAADDDDLYAMVEAVGESLCPELGIAIPVGKDSLSMRTAWEDDNGEKSVTAPVSLVVSAFAPVADVRRSLTPELARDVESVLVFVDLAAGNMCLGGSSVAQTFGVFGGDAADVTEPAAIKRFFMAQRELREADLVLAYHDRSDGGLIVTLLEMAFASRTGLAIELPDEVEDAIAYLFNEEPGVVLQVALSALDRTTGILERHGCGRFAVIARPESHGEVSIEHRGQRIYCQPRVDLHARWSELTYRMQSLRDDPGCAREACESALDLSDPGLNAVLTFELPSMSGREQAVDRRPAVAILREQGVNGQREMAAALDRAGFAAHDVHMSDLIEGRKSLEAFRGVVACGGFSYGDVLGAGEGWAKSILHNDRIRGMFAAFFAREDVFGLGVCNGCQALAALKSLIPGADSWPRFVRNRSDQFEGRLSLVAIEESPSVLLRGMAGSRLPAVTSHGEGRAEFAPGNREAATGAGLVAVRYVDNAGAVAERYPANPNGSPGGITGLTTGDGRVTIMMPHPERVFRTVQHSWHPREWGECSPWQRLFDNARAWIATG